MNGRLVHRLEYHYSDGAFGDGSHANITIRYYGKNIDSLIFRTLQYNFHECLFKDLKLLLNPYLIIH